MGKSGIHITLTALLYLGMCYGVVLSQEAGQCGTDILHRTHLEQDDAYRSQDQRLESAYRKASYTPHKRSMENVLEVPVVVHIIHNNGPENIDDDRVHRTIAWLNDAFRNVGFYNPDIGVDTEISFCLAKRDPEGNASNGINRIVSSSTDMSVDNYIPLNDLVSWNTYDYINIWVVSNVCLYGDCTINGYANLPGAHGKPYSGIVIRSVRMGLTPVSNITLVHEMGHFLGLYHPFYGDCLNTNCLEQGDRVCDTPPTKSTGSYPCGLNRNTCTTDEDDHSNNNPFRPLSLGGLGDQNDMDENYMDYSSSMCRKAFTQGQKDRMRFFLEQARSSLLSSLGCYEPCAEPVQAEFTINTIEVNAGDEISLTNLSINATGYQWYLDGSPYSALQDITLQLFEEGLHDIELEAYNDHVECASEFFKITIQVICPVNANFNFELGSSSITFDNLASGANSILWRIFTLEGNLLYSSDLDTDTFEFLNAGHYRICLEAKGEYCSDTDCREIYLAGSGFCVSDEDEDGDGLVGLFDTDCPCDPEAYQAQCTIDCQVLPDSFPEIKMRIKWVSDPVVNFDDLSSPIICGDINADGIVEIISLISLGTYTNNEHSIGIFSGADGSLLNKMTYETMDSGVSFGPSSFYRNQSLQKGFIVAANFDTLVCFDESGEIQWKSESIWDFTNSAWPKGSISIADINGDGLAEIVLGSLVINAETGKLLASGNLGAGANSYGLFNPISAYLNTHSTPAELLAEPGLEIAAGSTVYKVELNSTSDSTGNKMIPVVADPPVLDGFTSVADINGDGMLDVIVVRSNLFPDGGGIWVWDPRTRQLIATAEAGSVGGIPTIGDVDGDCIPDICIVFKDQLNLYTYTGAIDLELSYSLPITEGSGWSQTAMFDFNLDGKLEIVYRDEEQLMILDGPSGAILTSMPLTNGTWWEGPIIADVDKDGEADILVTGSQTSDEEARIFAIESAGTPWAPARSVWNQQGYHVTNVNDDLTIPRVQQNQAMAIPGTENCVQATCPAPYNGYGVQATMRTQEGCVQFPGLDLSLEITGYSCTADSISFCIVVSNESEAIAFNDTLWISCYEFSPTGGNGTPALETNWWIIPLDPMSSTDKLCMTNPIPASLNNMYFVVNDNGTALSPLPFPVTGVIECDYSNNVDQISVGIKPLSLDLGPDITKCESEVITLYAGEQQFVSWEWSDGTTDSLYSTSLPGKHFVTAYDACGRHISDTMEIFIDTIEQFSLGQDLEICENETLQFSVQLDSGWVQWFPSEIVDCDTCPTVQVNPDSTVYLIAVKGIQSCIYSDSVEITVKQPVTLFIHDTLCEGDTYTFFDTVIYESGEYEYTNSTCDTNYLLDLLPEHADTIFLEFQLCRGDSIQIAGSWHSDSGFYESYLNNANGCDSIVYFSIDMVESDTLSQSFDICEGDSILIDNSWYYDSGIHEFIYESSLGCDSIVFTNINLIECNFTVEFEATDISCYGDSTGAIKILLTSGTPPYFFTIIGNEETISGDISNLSIPITINELPAGTYYIEIIDEQGLSMIEQFIEILDPAEIITSLEITSEIYCPLDKSGSIDLSVSGGTGSYNYLWSNNAMTQDL